MRETYISVYKPAGDLWGFNRYDAKAQTGVPQNWQSLNVGIVAEISSS